MLSSIEPIEGRGHGFHFIYNIEMATKYIFKRKWLQGRDSGGSGGEMFTLLFSLEDKDKGGVFCLPILPVHPGGSTEILQKLPPLWMQGVTLTSSKAFIVIVI